jgi:hypothetical protein
MALSGAAAAAQATPGMDEEDLQAHIDFIRGGMDGGRGRPGSSVRCSYCDRTFHTERNCYKKQEHERLGVAPGPGSAAAKVGQATYDRAHRPTYEVTDVPDTMRPATRTDTAGTETPTPTPAPPAPLSTGPRLDSVGPTGNAPGGQW